MGNKSRRQPQRAPSVETFGPPTRPPQFAVVRHVTAGVSRINVFNLDHIVHAVAHVYGEESAIELWTLADLVAQNEHRQFTFTGDAASNLLAHLILCGIDVEGAPAALARARGDMYAPYFKGTKDAGERFDEEGGGCANLTPPPPAPPISVEEHAAELRALRASAKVSLAEIHAGEVDAEIRALDEDERDRGISRFQDTRASCAFGENCRRFPACGDCSLYALDRACESAHRGEGEEGDSDRRVVHVEHVEQVSGEPSAALLARVERCGVFIGLKRGGVVPGDKWCGVGHEMTDPACALCPYLRIYAPTAPIAAR